MEYSDVLLDWTKANDLLRCLRVCESVGVYVCVVGCMICSGGSLTTCNL